MVRQEKSKFTEIYSPHNSFAYCWYTRSLFVDIAARDGNIVVSRRIMLESCNKRVGDSDSEKLSYCIKFQVHVNA